LITKITTVEISSQYINFNYLNNSHEHSSSDDFGSALTIIVSVQSSIQSSKEQSSIAPTLVVPPSDEDTEIQSSTQSSEEGNQSIASRARLNRHANEPQPTDSDMRAVHLRLIVNTK
jgi:hypothetical protein